MGALTLNHWTTREVPWEKEKKKKNTGKNLAPPIGTRAVSALKERPDVSTARCPQRGGTEVQPAPEDGPLGCFHFALAGAAAYLYIISHLPEWPRIIKL